MKKSHVWLGLCLLLALAALKQDSAAQLAPANNAMAGEGLAEAGDKARQALTSGDYQTLHEMLDVASRGQLALFQEKFNLALEGEKLSDEQVGKMAAQWDPGNVLKIQTLEDLKGLSEADFFGLISMVLRMQAEANPKNANLKWHLVAKGVGMQESHSKLLRKLDILTWVGAVAFANSADEELAFLFSLDGSEWKLTQIKADTKAGKFDMTSMLETFEKSKVAEGRWPGSIKEKQHEGMQLGGSARDFSRVTYSKNGDWDATAVASFDAEIGSGAFDGEYYKVVTIHVDLPSSNYDAAIEVHPVDSTHPWGLMQFKWASGESKLEWFDTQAELDAFVVKQAAQKGK